MKNKKIASMAALIAASLSAAHAQTTITAWNFDSDGLQTAPYNSPAPSTGSGIASVLGMSNTYSGTNSVAGADIINSVTGSSTPSQPDEWRIRGLTTNPQPNAGNGWSSQAPIGSQGAEFAASTAGFNNIQVSFDIAPTTKGTAYVQLEYTTDGVIWNNATLTYAANPALVLNNSTPASGGNGIVVGSYLNMVGTAQFYNGVTANLTGITAANNDPNFAIEIVNAAEGTSDLAANNAIQGATGNWSIDNVVIESVPEPTTLALAGLGGLAALVAVRRRK